MSAVIKLLANGKKVHQHVMLTNEISLKDVLDAIEELSKGLSGIKKANEGPVERMLPK